MRTVLYHVTQTSNVPKIIKRGIKTMQTTNWVKAGTRERYGDGEIFAFEELTDAIRWATNYNWSLTKSWANFKVSIVEFNTDIDLWEEDTADPVSRSGQTGRWLKSNTSVKPVQILRADPLTMNDIKSLSKSSLKEGHDTMIENLNSEELNHLTHVYSTLKRYWHAYVDGHESATETIKLFTDLLRNQNDFIPVEFNIRKLLSVDQSLTKGSIVKMTDHLEAEAERDYERKNRVAYITPNWQLTLKTIKGQSKQLTTEGLTRDKRQSNRLTRAATFKDTLRAEAHAIWSAYCGTTKYPASEDR